MKLPSTKGLDNHQMVEAIHAGKLKAMYLIGEEMSIVDSNANYVGDGVREARFLRRAGHFLQQHVPLCRCGVARRPEPGKRGDIHQHREAHPAALSGAGTDSRAAGQTGRSLRTSPTAWVRIGTISILPRSWTKLLRSRRCSPASTTSGSRDTSPCNGQSLLTEPTSRCSTRSDLPFPTEKRRLFPVSWIGPTDQPNAEFDLHLNNGRLLEHFHEGNLTYRTEGIREKTPDTFVEVSPELAEERGIQSGTWVQLISRYGKVRVRALGHRPCAWQGALHADELGRESGESVDQQPHRSGDQHARLQGDQRSAERTLPKSARVHCRGSIPASVIPRRRTEWKWNANGNDRTTPPPGNGNGLVQLQTKK